MAKTALVLGGGAPNATLMSGALVAFAEAGVHTRTSVGVYQLPKGAAVEVDMIVALKPLVAPLDEDSISD